MPTWRQRQDICSSSTDLFMVGNVLAPAYTTCIFVALLNSRVLTTPRVPKELISRFVKLCPTCQIRRGVSHLTPPNSQKGSPGLETACHSPKLPSPPTSRRESIFNSQVSQAEYLGQFGEHHGWVDSPHNIHGRQGIGPEPIRSFGGGPLSNLSNPVSALDPFTGDVAVPSPQLNYSPGYGSGNGIFNH